MRMSAKYYLYSQLVQVDRPCVLWVSPGGASSVLVGPGDRVPPRSGLRFRRIAISTASGPLDWANLTGLVLGCIEAKFCKKICVGIRIYLKTLAEIYKMHSFAPFWNRIPKNEEKLGKRRAWPRQHLEEMTRRSP